MKVTYSPIRKDCQLLFLLEVLAEGEVQAEYFQYWLPGKKERIDGKEEESITRKIKFDCLCFLIKEVTCGCTLQISDMGRNGFEQC